MRQTVLVAAHAQMIRMVFYGVLPFKFQSCEISPSNVTWAARKAIYLFEGYDVIKTRVQFVPLF